MRDSIDAVLEHIGAESLTDDEFDSLEIEAFALDFDTYQAIREVLEARENVSDSVNRLGLYFQSAGVELSGEDPTASSNILIGDTLED